MNIKKIPTSELIDDLYDTVADIELCEMAVTHGVKEYSGGSIQERLIENKIIEGKIRKELWRRGIHQSC